MEKRQKIGKPLKHTTLAAVLAALLAVSVANAAFVIFGKTVQITVSEPILLSNPNWLPASQTVSPGQNTNYTVDISNVGPNPHHVEIDLDVVSGGPSGAARLYANNTLVLTAFFAGNSTSKTYAINPFNPNTLYNLRLNLDIPSTSPPGSVNMTVTVTRVG